MELEKIAGMNKGIKSYRWIILSALVFVVLLNSCTQLRSVRHYAGPYVVKKEAGGVEIPTDDAKAIQVNPDDPKLKQNRDILAKLEEFREMAEKQQSGEGLKPEEGLLATSDNRPVKSVRRRLPTLREQMREIADKQVAMESRLNNIEGDISDIRGDIASINRKLDNITTRDAGAIAGVQQKRAENPNYASQTFFDDEDIILPEEMEEPKAKAKPKKTVKTDQAKIHDDPKPAANTNQEQQKEKLAAIAKNVESKDYSNALNSLNKLLKESENPTIIVNCHYWIGESYFGLEQFEDAIEHFKMVVDSKIPDNKPKARIMIAESLIRTGKVKEAKKEYSTLIANHPSSEYVPDARKMLQKL